MLNYFIIQHKHAQPTKKGHSRNFLLAFATNDYPASTGIVQRLKNIGQTLCAADKRDKSNFTLEDLGSEVFSNLGM